MAQTPISGATQFEVAAPSRRVIDLLVRTCVVQNPWAHVIVRGQKPIDLAAGDVPGRFMLTGRNPVGTAPLWGTVAVDPAADPQHCAVTVSTWPDPTLAPTHWTPEQTRRHHELAAQTIGRTLEALITTQLQGTALE